MLDPELSITAGALGAGCVLVAAMVFAERRPRKSLEPALIPTTPIMFIGAMIALLALVHLLSLFGLQTGRRF